jgi:hypothetical protein
MMIFVCTLFVLVSGGSSGKKQPATVTYCRTFDEAWATLGPYFLKESQQYSSWRRSGVERSFSNTSQSADELRATGVYAILTPDQALARIKAASADYMLIVQPLTGGLPIERAWRCMELFGEVMGRV